MQAIKTRLGAVLLPTFIVLTPVFVQVGCARATVLAPTASPSPSASLAPTGSPVAANAAAPGQQPNMTAQAPNQPGQPAAPPSQTGAPPPPPPPPPPAEKLPPPPPPRTFTLAAGRNISVFTASTISTKASKTGDTFVASLASPIVDRDWVIAKQGALVNGVVSSSDPGGKVKGVASISVRLRSLQLADGTTIEISTGSYLAQAKGAKKKDAAKIGIGAGIGAAIGAIAGGGKGAAIGAGIGGGGGTAMVLATRGDPAVIPGESQISFKLAAPVTVTRR